MLKKHLLQTMAISMCQTNVKKENNNAISMCISTAAFNQIYNGQIC